MTRMYRDAVKVERIINSIDNINQLRIARNLVKCFYKKHKDFLPLDYFLNKINKKIMQIAKVNHD